MSISKKPYISGPVDEFEIPIIAHVKIGSITTSYDGTKNPVQAGLEMVAEWVGSTQAETFDVDFRVGEFIVSINSQEVPRG